MFNIVGYFFRHRMTDQEYRFSVSLIEAVNAAAASCVFEKKGSGFEMDSVMSDGNMLYALLDRDYEPLPRIDLVRFLNIQGFSNMKPDDIYTSAVEVIYGMLGTAREYSACLGYSEPGGLLVDYSHRLAVAYPVEYLIGLDTRKLSILYLKERLSDLLSMFIRQEDLSGEYPVSEMEDIRKSLVKEYGISGNGNRLRFQSASSPSDNPGTECLGIWYPARFRIDDQVFFSAGHFIALKKAESFYMKDLKERLENANDAYDAMCMAMEMPRIRFWEERNPFIMMLANVAKFAENDGMLDILMSTGNRYLEESAFETDALEFFGDSSSSNATGWSLMVLRKIMGMDNVSRMSLSYEDLSRKSVYADFPVEDKALCIPDAYLLSSRPDAEIFVGANGLGLKVTGPGGNEDYSLDALFSFCTRAFSDLEDMVHPDEEISSYYLYRDRLMEAIKAHHLILDYLITGGRDAQSASRYMLDILVVQMSILLEKNALCYERLCEEKMIRMRRRADDVRRSAEELRNYYYEKSGDYSRILRYMDLSSGPEE